MFAKAVSIGLVLSLCMCVLSLLAVPSSAVPVTQQLYPDSDIRNDLFVLRDDQVTPIWELMQKTVPRAFGVQDYDVGTSTGDFPSYYDGDPGCVYWPNYSAANPTTGEGVMKLGLTDPVGETASYYTVDVRVYLNTLFGWNYGAAYPPSQPTFGRWTLPEGYNDGNLAISIGVGFAASDEVASDYESARDYVDLPHATADLTMGYLGGLTVTGLQMNDSGTLRPFSSAEVAEMYVVVALVFSDSVRTNIDIYGTPADPYSVWLAYLDVQIVPAVYTPPPPYVPPVGSFILRPDSDVLNASWGAYPSTVDGMYDSTNETPLGGDGLLTYAWTSYSYRGSWVLGFTDCPAGYVYADKFLVRPWVIAKSTTASTGMLQVLIFDQTARSDVTTVALTTLPSYFSNQSSTAYVPNPRTNTTWTIADINNLGMEVVGLDIGTSAGALYVTQIGLLVMPVFSETSHWDFSAMTDWLGGNGILTMIGVFGFCILIAVPTMAVIAYRDGDDSAFGSVVHAAVLMVIGFGFFLVGLIG